MGLFELSFASGEGSLSVRRFAAREAMSSLFSVSIWARSPDDEIDLEAIVSHPMSLRFDSGKAFALYPARSWSGLCSYMELLEAEPSGLSTYYLRLVPRMWLLTQRRNHRIFQHQTIPEIVEAILAEWDVPRTFRVREAEYPKLETRVQYGETDFDFVSRLLEEAGISFSFAADGEVASALVVHDDPGASAPRDGGPIPYVGSTSQAGERELVTGVHVAQQVRPGQVTLRDHDFRRPRFPLFGRKAAAHAVEDRLELYAYSPGGFLRELLPEAVTAGPAPAYGLPARLAPLVGDALGMARHTEAMGRDRAQKRLESARALRRVVTFDTNCLDLSPGAVISFGGHPRAALGDDRKLLVTDVSMEGAPGEEWGASAAAVFAELPYRPPLSTPKPSVQGLQSAVVVGPAGEDIHTDEHGRVKVQFHWDREGGYDERSSCWMRVSQGWAGGGHGMVAIPRVGHEVLVAFLEGDPDLPVVVGRLFNATAPGPYALPTHKTRSAWRSESTPGSGGFNEIMFEDKKGGELLYLQAERDLEKVVKQTEAVTVGLDRRASVGAVDETLVGVRHAVTMRQAPGEAGGAGPTFFEMVDRRIRLSTGEASITLDGPNITLEAKGRIFVHSQENDVELLGGPWVKINCEPPVNGASDTVSMHHVTGIVRDQDGNALPDYVVVVQGSDGAVQQVTTDANGKYFALVPPGETEVSLPGGKRYGTRGTNLNWMDEDPEVFDDMGPVG
jgi:type VI secretion system secreted protein VgrG